MAPGTAPAAPFFHQRMHQQRMHQLVACGLFLFVLRLPSVK